MLVIFGIDFWYCIIGEYIREYYGMFILICSFSMYWFLKFVIKNYKYSIVIRNYLNYLYIKVLKIEYFIF